MLSVQIPWDRTYAPVKMDTKETDFHAQISMNVLLTHAKTEALAMTWLEDIHAIAQIHTVEMYVKQMMDVLSIKLGLVKQGWRRLSVVKLQTILK